MQVTRKAPFEGVLDNILKRRYIIKHLRKETATGGGGGGLKV